MSRIWAKNLVLFCFLMVKIVLAQTDLTGTTGANFLKLGTDARSMGMGEAVTSLPGNIMSAYWNPAAIEMQTSHVGLMHHVYVQGVFQDYVGFFMPATSKYAVGVSLNYLNAGSFDQTIKTGPNQFEKQGTFDAFNYYFTITNVFVIRRGLQVGANLKGIKEKIADYQGSAFAVDFGLWSGFENLSFGLAIRNLGSGMQLKDERFKLPVIFNYGIAFRQRWFTLALDLHQPLDNVLQPKLGLEVSPFSVLTLRGGYRFGYLKDDLGGSAGLSLGVGLNYRDFSFDYAYNPMGVLGQSHRISLVYAFQRKKTKPAILNIVANPDVVLRREDKILQDAQLNINPKNCKTIKYWELDITDDTNKIIREWKGKETPPQIIKWDGKDQMGNSVEAKTYQYRLQIWGCASNTLSASGKLSVVDLLKIKKAKVNEKKSKKSTRKFTRHFTLGDVLFDTDRATIRPSEQERLNEVVQLLKLHPDAQVIVEGHTDDRASSEYNMKLSLARANSVKNYLVKNANILPSQIFVQGFGETKPLVENNSEENRQKNRRVEITVTYFDTEPKDDFQLIESWFKEQKYQKIIDNLQSHTIETLKEKPELFYYLGESYFQKGQLKKASYYFKRYIQNVQSGKFRSQALQRLGQISLHKKTLDEPMENEPVLKTHPEIENWYRLSKLAEKAALLYDAAMREESADSKALLLEEARKAEEEARNFAKKSGFIFVKLVVKSEHSIYDLFSKVPELQKSFLERKIIYAWQGKITSVHTLIPGQIIFVIAK